MGVIYTSSVYTKSRKDGKTNPKYSYYATVDIQSQDVAANTSTVLFTLYMYTNLNGSLMWDTNVDSYAARSSITVENETYASSSNVDQGSNGSGLYIVNGGIREYTASTTPIAICKQTLTIPHNNDGTKSISLSFNWIAGPSSQTNVYYPVSFASNGATVALTAIPRSGAISGANSITVSNTTSNYSYTITSYANYYYNLSLALDGHTLTLLTRQSINTTTYSGAVSYSWFLSNLNTATSKSAVFTLETWTASSGGTKIGTTTKSVVVNISTTVYKPTVSLSAITPGTTPIAGYLVAEYSTASIPYSTTKPTGTTGLTVYFTVSHGTMATASTATESGSVLTNTLPAVDRNNTYTLTISAYAKDSRGAISATVSKTATVYPYQKPSISATAMRVSGSGSTTEDGAGEYVYILYSATVNASVNGQNTIQSEDCVYNSTSYTSPSWVALQADTSGTFVFTASDKVSSVSTTITVPMAVYPLDLYDDGTAQHLGVGLAGAVAEADKVKSAKDVYAPSVYAGTSTDTTERRVRVDSGAGGMYMFSQASTTGSRGIYLPAHGTGSAKAAISVDTNNNVVLNGSATSATYANQLNSYPSVRPASPDISNNAARMYHFLASGSMTTNKPATDGQIISMEWDNTNIMGSQLFLCHSNGQHNALGWRGSGSSAWYPWAYADLRRQLWTGTTAGQGSKSISLNVSGYSYLKIWAHCYDVCFSFDVDLTKAPSHTVAGATGNSAYRGSGVAPLYTEDASNVRMEQYFCMVEVNSGKTSLTVVQIGYFRGSGTYEKRLNNAEYYIYKIEGYL